MSKLHKILKNDYVYNIVNKGYTIFIGLLSSAFMTRFLGVEYRGDYAFITQIVVIASNILGFGMYQSYSYFYKKSKDKEKIFQQYITIYIFQFFLYTLISIVVLFLHHNYFLYFLAAILLPSQIFYQQLEATMAVENIRLKISLNMILNTVRLFIYIAVFYLFESSLSIAVGITLLLNIIISFSYIFIYRIKPSLKFIDFNLIVKIIKFSWLPMLTSLLITFNYSVDTIMLKYLSDSYSLSIYSVAAGIITYFWFIPDAFKEVLVSRVTREKGSDSTNIAIKVSLLVMIIVIIAFLIFGNIAIYIFYGKEFMASYPITLILSIGGISMIFYKMIGVVLLAEGDTKVYFINLFISAASNVAINFLVIPIWGMYGAAVSTVISYTICGWLFLVFYCKKTDQSIREVLFFKKGELKRMVRK
ncbi:polysaccharide biosynthesis C-terminal domain-containing protein [Enterococcus casseliflavus]|uniref:oligosaccharide flippase family protein n=1 Tax=Enterococcus casseliflavus TaxID=37734 RepID=UPI003D13B869